MMEKFVRISVRRLRWYKSPCDHPHLLPDGRGAALRQNANRWQCVHSENESETATSEPVHAVCECCRVTSMNPIQAGSFRDWCFPGGPNPRCYGWKSKYHPDETAGSSSSPPGPLNRLDFADFRACKHSPSCLGLRKTMCLRRAWNIHREMRAAHMVLVTVSDSSWRLMNEILSSKFTHCLCC